jgi:hypothetical protein
LKGAKRAISSRFFLGRLLSRQTRNPPLRGGTTGFCVCE